MYKWRYLFISLFGAALFFGSVARADSLEVWNGTFDQYMTFLENTKTMTATGNAGWNDFIIREQNQLKNQITSKLHIGVDDCKGFLMSTSETSTYAQLFIITTNNGYEINVNDLFIGGTNVKGVQVRMWRDSNNLIRIDSTSTNNMGTGSYTGVINSTPNNGNYYNSIINCELTSISIDFELASGDVLTDYEGYSDVTAIKNTYQNSYWYIGTFINLDSITEVECKLIDLQTNINIGNKYKSLLIDDGVYYDSNLLEFGKVYRFYYDAYLDGSIIQNDFYDIVFVGYSSGDSFNLQDLANLLLKNQLTASDISNILGEYPSGDGEATGFLGGLLKGIKGLFIPSDGFLGSYFSDLNNWFSERLGILYFPFDFIVDFLNRILTIDFSEPHMELGPYQLPNYSGDVVPKINIDFNNFLEDELVNDIHDTYLIIVDGILIFWLIRLFQKKYDEVIGGKGQ